MRAFTYTDYSIPPHTHGFYEINVILSGHGLHKIEDTSIQARPGDVFVIPPMTIHAYENTQNLDVFHILLHQSFIQRDREEAALVPGFLQLTEIEPFLRRIFSDPMFLHLSQSQMIQLQEDLKFITDGGLYDQPELMPLKNHTTWKILYWFSHLLSEQLHASGTAPIQYLQDYRRKKAAQMLEEGKLSKTEIAALCGFYDLSHMMRTLKM